MTVLSISRDWGFEPCIVRMLVDNTLAEITTTGYLNDEAENIELLNAGEFTWLDSDIVLIKYDTDFGFFVRNATNADFEEVAIPGALSQTLASGDVFVGSAGNVATGVTMSGDATMSNTGVLTIANNAITSAKMAANVLKYAQVSVTAAEFLGMYVTPKLLVAAAGANTQIVLHSAKILLDYGTVQLANGGAVHIQYDSTTLGAGTKATDTIAAAGFTGAVADSTAQFSGTQAMALASTTVNKGLYLSNASAAFITGDSTFKVDVWYSTVSYA